MNARLIGINSAIYSKSGGSIGIGFAIPVNMVKVVVATAKGGGKQVRRPWIGAQFQAVSREIADSLGMDRPSGALVSDVRPDGPAADAGLKRGDVVVSVDGQAIDDPEGLGYRLATHPLGISVALGVARGGRTLSLPVKLTAAPEVPARDAAKIVGRNPLSGAIVWNISPAVADELSVENVTQGVVVAEVEEGSTAADVGIQKSDIILAVNDTKVATTNDLRKALAARQSYWKLTINRGGQVLTTVLGG
jgi:S1-C subfamily serine protease